MQNNIILLLILSGLFFIPSKPIHAQKSDNQIRTIVIDPGHGGKDPGAVGKISKEKDLVLSISLKVGALIEEYFSDVSVIYTRETDKYLKLAERTKIANKNEADLFISIHINAINGANAYGAETYAMGLHVSNENLRVAKLENSVVLEEDDYEDNYAGFDPNSPESHIIFSLYQNAYLDQSLKLAQSMQHYLSTDAKRYDRGVKQAGFLVLWRTSMPAILVECGFISNPNEEQFLNSEEGQNKVAESIFNAFKDYKLSYDSESKEIEAENKLNDSIKPNIEHINSAINIEKELPSGIIFGIQIKSSSNEISNTNKFSGIDETIYEYEHNGLFKYFVGGVKDYDYILSLHKEIKVYYSDCFIIAFKDGDRITLKQAKKEIK